MRNLASLFFAFCFLFYSTSRNSRCKTRQVTMMINLKLQGCPRTKRSRYDLWKKIKFPKFLSFRFCSIPKIENSKISKICLFFQILTVIITQDLKTTKIWTEQKTESFPYKLKQKIKISEIFEFLILPYTQDRKPGNLGNFVYLEFGRNSRFKNAKEMSWDKN